MENLLGFMLTDIITGFTGMCTGQCQYITGCNQVLLQPVCEEGKMNTRPEAQWFDEQRVSVVPNSLRLTLDNGATPGFDKPAPTR